MGALQDELIGIRMELKGVREAVAGVKSFTRAQEGVVTSTTKAGTAATKAEKRTSGLTRAYQSLGKTARWGLGFLGVGGVFALKSAIEHSEELAKTTTGLSRNLDLNTNVASRWGAVAQAREIDSKSLTMSFTTLSRKLTEAAREGGTALTPFHQLGISQEEAAKGADNFSWFLGRVAEKFGDAEGGAKRQAAAQGLLGRGYATILPLFSEGAKGLQEQLYWADKYGVTLSGTTNEALMESVTAQRESKMAMLGLQLALTKALLPAIDAGHHELQKFIATLNDPNMSGDEKIAAIERQFEHLEDKLVDILTAALPHIAEHGGELGVKLAVAVWHGFRQSDLLGKVVIAAWVFSLFGGKEIALAGARKVGGRIGISMGGGVVAGATGVFLGYELWNTLSERSQMELALTATNAGIEFANYFIRAWNAANPLPFGVGDAGEIDSVHGDLTPQEAFAPPAGSGTAPQILGGSGGHHRNSKRAAYEKLWGQPPPAGPPPWPPPHRSSDRDRSHRRGSTHRLPSAAGRTQRLPTQSLPRERGWGRGRLGSVTIQVPVDGKVVAEKTVDIAELEASLK